MSTVDPLLSDPRLEPLLPLLHAAWSDGELSPAEMRRLCVVVVNLVDDDCASILLGWLDPDRPPSPADLSRLAAEIRRRAPVEARGLGPTDLGLRLAGSIPDSAVEALRRVDSEVGPFGRSAASGLVEAEPASTFDPLPDPGPAGFDLSELVEILDGPHRDVKASVRQILSGPDFAYRYDLSIDEYRSQVREWLQVLADAKVGQLGFPPEVGGGGDPGGFIAASAMLAHHDLSLLVKFGVQYGLFAGTVMRLGTEKHRPVVAGAIALDPLGCFAMTETGHGSNVAGLETTATFVDGDFEIHTPSGQARKDFIGGAAADAASAVVFARLVMNGLDQGVHAFLVPIRSGSGEALPGVTIGDDGAKAGLNGVDNGHISFDRVRVPADALLDRFASVEPDGTYRSAITSSARRFFTTLGTLVGGRVSLAIGAVSVAESALAIAVRYATRRRQFSTDGPTETRLIDYPTHQRRLMPRLAATYAFHLAAADLAAEYVGLESEAGDTGHDRREFEGRAAGLKAFATWHALDTVQECREACGGQGYMSVNRLGSMRQDIDVFATFEGDNTVLAQLLAKSLLTNHRASFEDMTPGRLVRYVADRVAAIVTESVPVVGSVSGELSDPDTSEALLERRSRLLTDKLAARVKRRTDAGADAGDAFNDVQAHAVSAARAATQLDVYQAMRRVEVTDTELAGVLDDLAVLAALWWIEADLGWYVVTGLVTANGAKEVRATIDFLSDRLASQARHLVDAFNIPDPVLAAPIAL